MQYLVGELTLRFFSWTLFSLYTSSFHRHQAEYLVDLHIAVCSGVTGPGPTRACARASTRNANDIHIL